MQPHPILTLKRFFAPGLAGGILGFIIFLMLTYPEAMSADLPLPPTLAFGSGPRVELQSMLLNLRTDLYWLTIFLNHGFGFIGLFALAFTGIAALIERIETNVSKQTGTAFSIPTIPVRYLLSALTGLVLGLLLDFAWMSVSFQTVYLHFTCIELLCSQACLGVLVMFTHDELRKLSPIEPQYAAFKRRVAFRVFLAFAAITYFLFTEKFAWPCEWFLSSFPQLDWSGLTLKEWIVVTILTTIYTSSTSYACFAFLVLNRPAQTNDSVCKPISPPEPAKKNHHIVLHRVIQKCFHCIVRNIELFGGRFEYAPEHVARKLDARVGYDLTDQSNSTK